MSSIAFCGLLAHAHVILERWVLFEKMLPAKILKWHIGFTKIAACIFQKMPFYGNHLGHFWILCRNEFGGTIFRRRMLFWTVLDYDLPLFFRRTWSRAQKCLDSNTKKVPCTRVVSLFRTNWGHFCDLTKNRFYNCIQIYNFISGICSAKTKNLKI